MKAVSSNKQERKAKKPSVPALHVADASAFAVPYSNASSK
jgi:hypothetical protein